MNLISIITFFVVTGLVAVISYYRTRNEDLSHSDGYFLAGRNLPWYVVGGSMFLTNISAEQITGLNGNAFAGGASSMAWETLAVVALVLMALYFLPRYLKSGITTVPQFLEYRFGRNMRTVASFIFMYALIVAFLPFVLYAGAITLGQLFDISTMLGVSEKQALWILVIALGAVGGAYALIGGLKAVAVSDTLNGILLIIGGFAIPLMGLYQLGDNSIAEGWQILMENAPERMRAAGSEVDEVPWHTLFTGILLINIFYWCTNQAIVQRTFGARNLAEGQKGVLIAGLMKLAGVSMLVLPGIIAWHMHQRGMITVPVREVVATGEVKEVQDFAYPLMVQYVLPHWMVGFFGAVMFGAVLSSFNSGLNSLCTIFSLDVYKHLIRKQATDSEIVVAGKAFGIAILVVCVLIAPLIGRAEGLYTLMREVIAVVNVPILTVLLMGMFSRRAPALGAFIALPAGILFYCYFNFIRGNDFFFFHVHWLHTVGLNFLFMWGIMFLVRYLKPMDMPFIQKETRKVDLTGWKYVREASWGIIILLLILYAVFSKIGILGAGDHALRNFIYILIASVILFFIGIYFLRRTGKKFWKWEFALNGPGDKIRE
jgi:solute:Na+ symporter, SSS family